MKNLNKRHKPLQDLAKDLKFKALGGLKDYSFPKIGRR